jgi:prepilin-type N-terminal cleavage/methylation domain-containing protein
MINMKNKQLSWLLLFQRLRLNKNRGFSLVEQIVSLVIGSLIVAALLGMMTEFINSDKKEAAFLATEKDTQIALDYITEDLREAVFVYETIPTRLTDALPNFAAIPELGSSVQPILAFWKTEAIPQAQMPTACTAAQGFTIARRREECRLLLITRNSYTLVVYLQTTEPSTEWLGRSRIIRYALTQYTNPQRLTASIGFVNPAVDNNFLTWPLDKYGVNQQSQRPNPSANTTPRQPQPMVLTDFIDIPDRTQFRSASNPDLPPTPLVCPNAPTTYVRVPSNTATSNSFFACVRNTQGRLGTNQDIIVYLRGNAEGRDRLTKTTELIPSLQAQVTLRGVIDKFGR